MGRAWAAHMEFLNFSVNPSVPMDNLSHGPKNSLWKDPDFKSLKINCDVAVEKDGFVGMVVVLVVVVVWNHEGKLVDGLTRQVKFASNFSRGGFGYMASLFTC
ncbi:hypothetical protein RHMOL_Rhmol06G0013300 [Rhododendron molle]|uniref:Uncharacterized protein n=1 Tax=Rhododendron molle TaxID=49168 RepID=A0ACC0N9S2_RHOML|nr:hypothetical protein RHMOL_Rhmol06G0013300 [Rhododendron molle]